MLNHVPLTILGASITCSVCSVQSPTADASVQTEDRSDRVTVYSVAADVTAPVLLSSDALDISSEKCKKKDQNRYEVQLSFFVTSNGEPRYTTFLHPLGNELDIIGLRLVSEDKFKSGALKGEPAAVWQIDTIRFEACRKRTKDAGGNRIESLRLISQPMQTLSPLEQAPPLSDLEFPVASLPDSEIQAPVKFDRVGGRVRAPVPLLTPEAHYSDEARRRKISGICLISLMIDAHGLPQNPRIVRAIGYGLDEQALDAVRLYRFKPAMKDGVHTVPVMMSIEVNFRLY
jgi:TonB family protein